MFYVPANGEPKIPTASSTQIKKRTAIIKRIRIIFFFFDIMAIMLF